MRDLKTKLKGILTFQTDFGEYAGQRIVLEDPQVFTIWMREERKVPDPSRMEPFEIRDNDRKSIGTVLYDNTPAEGHFDPQLRRMEIPVGLRFDIPLFDAYLELTLGTEPAPRVGTFEVAGRRLAREQGGASVKLAGAGTFTGLLSPLKGHHCAIEIDGRIEPDPFP